MYVVVSQWAIHATDLFKLRVDQLSALILSIFMVIDISHFQNRFAD